MWTSRPHERQISPTLMARVLETLGLVFAFALLPELVGAGAGAAREPHPGWIAVLVLAARYGGSGLLVGLIAAAGATAIGSALVGSGLSPLWGRLDGLDLIAFGACLAVSWVASLHLRLQSRLFERVHVLSDQAFADQQTIETLHGVVAALRTRVDRTSTSLSFLRDIATRLEGMDLVAAAEAAADLAIARTGACAAAVKAGMGGFERRLAVRDARGPKGLTPLGLERADLTVPIRKGDDWVGAIELWGIDRSGLDRASAHDLGVIASWCARALNCSALRQRPVARHAGDAP